MMIAVLMSVFVLLFMDSCFTGVVLFFMMYMYFLMGFYLLGLNCIKGDLFGMMGGDNVAFLLFLLLMWLISIILILFYNYFLMVLVLILFFSMFFMFFSLDLVYLFIYFEFSMIPMFLMIMLFGGSKERYLSILYMFIYTLVSSLPMLLVLLFIKSWLGGSGMDYMMFIYYDFDSWVCMVMIFMFLVKIPMFMLHIWLPKAHVEAPVYGSMILASVMLKMGGYGVVRCLDFMMFDIWINDFFFCLCLVGGVLISYMCIYQIDLKVLVAYSSIVHMGMMLMGFFSESEIGHGGGVIMMLSHGICSSGMFFLVNVIYGATGSRLLLLNKGIMGVYPILMWMWFVLLLNNLGIPPCFGVLGELMLIGGCLMYSNFIFIFFLFFVFFVSCFVMNMYVLLVGGEYMFRFKFIQLVFFYGAIMHLIPLNFFIFFISSCF